MSRRPETERASQRRLTAQGQWREGLEVDGIVLNVVDFGALVVKGVDAIGPDDASCLADRSVVAHEVVHVGDRMRLWVVRAVSRRRLWLPAAPLCRTIT